MKIPPNSPMKAALLLTLGKNMPKMNNAPSPLVSNPKKVLNWSQSEATFQVASTTAIAVPSIPMITPDHRATAISWVKDEFGKRVL